MDNQRDKQEQYPRAELSADNNLFARDKRLEEIRLAHEGTTEGTWTWDGAETVVIDETGRFIASVYDDEDAVFIAKSRDDVGYLLEEIERLQKIDYDRVHKSHLKTALDEVSQLREERDKLKQELTKKDLKIIGLEANLQARYADYFAKADKRFKNGFWDLGIGE